MHEAYRDSDSVYCYRKVLEDILEQNLRCCLESVRRTMREEGLISKVKRQFVVTTDSNHHFPVAENLFDRRNMKWRRMNIISVEHRCRSDQIQVLVSTGMTSNRLVAIFQQRFDPLARVPIPVGEPTRLSFCCH
ncbi:MULTISPECIES: IS3 family transposase [Gimesia]|uniref:IS3 family transposase n=1 Tax=Gimesia TaxID=1649453 RepID=UPI001D145A1C